MFCFDHSANQRILLANAAPASLGLISFVLEYPGASRFQKLICFLHSDQIVFLLEQRPDDTRISCGCVKVYRVRVCSAKRNR